jgi:hypothetical protein
MVPDELPETRVADTELVGEPSPSSDPGVTEAPLATTHNLLEPFGRFRRGIDRLRGEFDANADERVVDEDEDLKVQLMLLREENARLKMANRRDSDIGTLIGQLRHLGSTAGETEIGDEVWSLLTELLVIREGLERACIEIEASILTVHERLRLLSVKFDDLTQDGEHRDGAVPRASR